MGFILPNHKIHTYIYIYIHTHTQLYMHIHKVRLTRYIFLYTRTSTCVQSRDNSDTIGTELSHLMVRTHQQAGHSSRSWWCDPSQWTSVASMATIKGDTQPTMLPRAIMWARARIILLVSLKEKKKFFFGSWCPHKETLVLIHQYKMLWRGYQSGKNNLIIHIVMLLISCVVNTSK